MSGARGRSGVAAGACLAVSLCAGPAHAQMMGPLYGPTNTTSKSGPPATWHFRVTAGGDWYENPYFIGAVPGTSYSATGEASLGHDWKFRSSSFTLSGRGGALYYPEISGFNQPTYGGAAGYAWAGRRSKLTLGQTYQHSNTRNMTALDAQGLPLPTSGYDSANSLLGYEHQFSRSWEFGMGGSFYYRNYDNPLLVGGQDVTGTVRLGTRTGRRRGLAYLAYQYTRSWIDQSTLPETTLPSVPLRSHQGLVGYLNQPPQGFGFEVAGGVGYVESVKKFYPSGRASLSERGKKTTAEVRYERSFGQAFGYGRPAVSDLVSALFSWQAVRRITLLADYNFGYRRDPLDESNTITSWIASAGFNWAIGGGVGFGARYLREHNDTLSLREGVPVNGNRVSASLSYGVDWR